MRILNNQAGCYGASIGAQSTKMGQQKKAGTSLSPPRKRNRFLFDGIMVPQAQRKPQIAFLGKPRGSALGQETFGPLQYDAMTLRYGTFLILTLLLTGFIGFGTYTTARLLRTWTPDRNLLLMPAETVIRLFMIGACIGLGLLSGLPFETLGWTLGDLDRQLLWGIGWGAVLAGIFHITTDWVIAGSGERFYSQAVIKHILPADADEFMLILVAMVPVVVLEELLFRSLLLGGLSPIAPPYVLAVVVGMVFGLLHSPQGLWGMIGAGAAGILFGLLFLQAGSIVLPLAAHYVTNMVQIALAMRER